MKGEIKVESNLGVGSRFIISLPLIVSDTIVTSSLLVKSSQNSLVYSKKNTPKLIKIDKENINAKRILLVEDSKPASLALSLTLKCFKCNIDYAENGNDAVNMAEKNNYAIILMDVGLPDFSGIEATKKIRNFTDEKKAQVPIVAITGHADNPESRQECLDAGVCKMLCKPAKKSSLNDIFNQYVFHSKQDNYNNQELSKSNVDNLTDYEEKIIDWEE